MAVKPESVTAAQVIMTALGVILILRSLVVLGTATMIPKYSQGLMHGSNMTGVGQSLSVIGIIGGVLLLVSAAGVGRAHWLPHLIGICVGMGVVIASLIFVLIGVLEAWIWLSASLAVVYLLWWSPSSVDWFSQ